MATSAMSESSELPMRYFLHSLHDFPSPCSPTSSHLILSHQPPCVPIRSNPPKLVRRSISLDTAHSNRPRPSTNPPGDCECTNIRLPVGSSLVSRSEEPEFGVSQTYAMRAYSMAIIGMQSQSLGLYSTREMLCLLDSHHHRGTRSRGFFTFRRYSSAL